MSLPFVDERIVNYLTYNKTQTEIATEKAQNITKRRNVNK